MAVDHRISVGAVVRDPAEEHRAATPLELFFDLCFVVAVAQASASLHHELVEGHIADGIVGFLMGFFGVWWAWMNFTWFASAHDADDVPYRLLTLLQMAGVLVYAAGVPAAVEDHVFTLAVAGYLIMRAALITQWLRVARHHPDLRTRSLRYAAGIATVQVLWLFILVTPPEWSAPLFLALAIGELLVPFWAERGAQGTYARLFHPGHIEERFGLFTIIVLGESILAASIGIRQIATEGISAGLIVIAIGGLLLAFGAWWLYFDHPGHLTPSRAVAFRWGYVHVVVFTSLAALGAGVYVAAEAEAGHTTERTGSLAVTLPTAGFLLGLVLLMLATHHAGNPLSIGTKVAGAVAIVTLGAVAPPATAVAGSAAVVVVLVTLMILAQFRPQRESNPP
jgi:low temperature requirement protein LtrA